nr:alpha/beta hydrolase [Saccharopolyspora gloriosae]
MSRVTRSSLAAVALPLLLLATGCDHPPLPAKPPLPSLPQAAVAPEKLARFYDQEPAWGPCADYATTDGDREAFANPGFECARVEVPLDYDRPEGPTAQIAMLRIPARGERIGSLQYNPGGPGQSGMSVAATMLADPLTTSPIGEKFDLIGFDPRGTGASTPALDCFTDAEREDGALTMLLRFGAVDWTEQQARDLADQCAERSGGSDVLEHVGTRDAAQDLDIIREVLGDEKLNLLGQSYGTRLGAVYAEMFPENVRALVLDGPLDPAAKTLDRFEAQMTVTQRSFDELAAFCATGPACPLGTDPARATENFQNIVRPLLDAPVPALDGRRLTFNDAIDATITGLADEAAYPVLVQGLTELTSGRGDMLLAMRDAASSRAPDGKYSNALEANLAINCLDEDRRTPAEETALKRAVYAAAPFTDPGRPVVDAHDGCEDWPVRPTLGIPYAEGIEGLPPTLAVAATGDPLTPYEGGVNLAETLGSSLLTVDVARHGTVLLGGNACVDGIVADYLETSRTPPEGARCAG